MADVYLDHAAAGPLSPAAKQAMDPFLMGDYGNPSSFHMKGKRVKDAMEEARADIASHLACRADEILFTSGGTESDNMAILGVARAAKAKGNHLIVSAFEHQAVLEAAVFLRDKEGFSLSIIQPTQDGLIEPEVVMSQVRPETVLVSIMLANNEIGTIQPIATIGNLIQKYRAEHGAGPFFHTDACQATPYLDLSVEKLHVDLMTINGSKMYGPKGVGALYIKRGIKIQPLQFGGAQERGLRPGTEFVAGIVGMAAALEEAQGMKKKESERLVPLRDRLIQGILQTIPKTRLNGDPIHRLPNNVNVSFLDLEGEALLLYLDAKGIYASTGSACTSASLDPSHVILSLGMPFEVAHGSMRFTLGRATTAEHIEYVLEILPPLVEKLRSISPVTVDDKYWKP
ncbi:cysteine desulfurase [Candidatus Uhrbacteria bacterium]|nr:cysteine desulfurase [Candidatus Uhrbacteria bacterium]